MIKGLKDFLKKKPYLRFLDKYGQHILEYALVISLVVAAIIIMGPYVIRSWNANLKGWDDSIEDSYKDPLLQAPDDIQLPGCVCAPTWTKIDCGAEGCAKTQMGYKRLCTPVGCPGTVKCEYDNTCCIYYGKKECGINANPECPDGFRRMTEECGNKAPVEKCIRDTTCDFVCLDKKITYEYGDVCPGDESGLPYSMSVIAVDPGDCTDPRKCKQQCKPPFEADGFNATCVCPSPYIKHNFYKSCVCDWANGWVEKSSCGGKKCYQGTCPAGQCSIFKP